MKRRNNIDALHSTERIEHKRKGKKEKTGKQGRGKDDGAGRKLEKEITKGQRRAPEGKRGGKRPIKKGIGLP